MKKKIIVVVLIFCVFFACGSKAYGFVSKEFLNGVNIVDPGKYKIENTADIVKELKDINLFDGNGIWDLTKEMKVHTYIKIIEKTKNNKYKIQFGESGYAIRYGNSGILSLFTINKVGGINQEHSINTLKEDFGLNEKCSDDDLYEGYTWNANIIVRAFQEQAAYNICLKKIYTGEDLNKIDEEETSSEWAPNGSTDIGQIVMKATETAKRWIRKNPLGAIAAFFAHLPRTLGDIFQYWANIVQTLPDGNAGHFGVTYKYEKLVTGDDKEYNKYINAGENNEETSAIKTINVQKDKNGNGIDDFKKHTPISYAIVDLYTVGIGNIDFFDINFLTGNKSVKYEKDLDGNKIEVARHSSNSIWMKFRNVVAALVRLGIYAAASILLVGLIWNGINIVRHTFDNPEAQVESKKIIGKLANAVFALVGTIVVMAICIYANESVLKFIGQSDTYELPIRVNVENVYSFSTTFTGYARYMSITSDPDQGLQIIGSAFEYMVFALADLVVAIIGIGRILVIWVLSVWGPITSIRYVFEKQNQLSLRRWAVIYASAVLIQIPIALIGRVGIYIA